MSSTVTLVKEAETLGRILRSVLSEAEYEPVILRVGALIARHLATELAPLLPPAHSASADGGAATAAPEGDGASASRALAEAKCIAEHVRGLPVKDPVEAEEAAAALVALIDQHSAP